MIGRRHKIFASILALIAFIFIAPDFVRVFVSYPTLGFDVDNDGRIYNTTKETPPEIASCQRIDLGRTDFNVLLAIFGGMGGRQYISPALTEIKLYAFCDGNPISQEKRFEPLWAKPDTSRFAGRLLLLIAQVVSTLIIWFGIRSVWERPVLSTLAFFYYIIWFNPGQTFVIYASAQYWAPAVLILEALQAILAGLGYWGFIFFALHFRTPKLQHGWPAALNWLSPLLPCVFVALQLWAFATPFGFRTEWAAGASFGVGFAIDALVGWIAWKRLGSLQFDNHQKARWVFAGCVVGLTAYLIADINASTSLLAKWWNPSENTILIFYLINGFLAYAILTPILKERVLDLRFAVGRNVTLIATLIILLSIVVIPMSRLEQYMEELIFERSGDSAAQSQLLQMLQFAIYVPCVAFVTYVVHHWATHINGFVDRILFPKRHDALRRLTEAAQRLEEQTTDPVEVDRELVDETADRLSLAWAAIFKARDGDFERGRTFKGLLNGQNPPGPKSQWRGKFAKQRTWTPIEITEASELTDATVHGIHLPALATPIRSAGTVIAIVFYGAHEGGDDIDDDERKALGELAHAASIAYQKIRREDFLGQIDDLRRRLGECQEQLGKAKT